MEGGEKITRSAFQEKLEGVIKEIGEKKLELKDELFREFCDLTGHDYSFYRKRGLAPAGFLMTFADPVLSETFFKFFVAFPTVIKGIIHSSSRVEFLSPLRLSGKYRERMELKKVEEKAGKRGNYFIVDLEVVLMDESGGKSATDLHQFFLRV